MTIGEDAPEPTRSQGVRVVRARPGQGRRPRPADAAAAFPPPGTSLDPTAATPVAPPALVPPTALQAEGNRFASVDSTDGRLALLAADVATLRAAPSPGKRPWFREVGSLVAVIALTLSIGTTFVSLTRTAQQDVHDRRQELSGLIQRITAIQREMYVTSVTYREDTATLQAISTYLNEEKLLDAKQAAQIMDAIPQQVGSSEYSLVAFSLSNSGSDDLVLKLLDRAIEAARDANDLVSALRTSGTKLFALGRFDEGRKQYGDALLVFGRFASSDPYYVAGTQFDTHAFWAFDELRYSFCERAGQHIEAARSFASLFTSIELRLTRLPELDAQLAECVPKPTGTPGLVP